MTKHKDIVVITNIQAKKKDNREATLERSAEMPRGRSGVKLGILDRNVTIHSDAAHKLQNMFGPRRATPEEYCRQTSIITKLQ